MPEQILFDQLLSALPDLLILPQVSFSSFLEAKGGSFRENFSQFARVRQKVVDFLICSQDFEIIAIVELDDSSHDVEKDRLTDEMLLSAGIKTIR